MKQGSKLKKNNIISLVMLFKNLMKNYRLQNWKFCEDALEHLIGKWNGELDTFYKEISRRVTEYKDQDLGTDWTGVILRV